jgi:hypothetical protein
MGVSACPYEANGDGDQRLLAGRFVHAYFAAAGNDDEDQDDENQEDGDVPEAEISARGGAKKWRRVKLPNGKYIDVAVVRKKGPRGGSTVAGEVHEQKGK